MFLFLSHGCRGGALERGFRRVINDVPLGSLLVQSDAVNGEPLLLQVKLPVCIRQRHLAQEAWVFLLDAQVYIFSTSSVTPLTLKPRRLARLLLLSCRFVSYSITACDRII